MADISKVSVNNTEYTIKDSTARTNATAAISTASAANTTVNTKVSKTGDTVSGAVGYKNSAFDISASSRTASTYAPTLEVYDKNNNLIGYFEGSQVTDGGCRASFGCRRTVSGNQVDNGIQFRVSNAGARSIIFMGDAAEALRNGLGIPEFTYSTTALTAGTSSLTTGKIYIQYTA